MSRLLTIIPKKLEDASAFRTSDRIFPCNPTRNRVYSGAVKAKKSTKWNKDEIKALRQHLGFTQAELAGELGTRQQTISEWETGMYQPRGASATLLSIVAEQSKFSYGEGVDKRDESG